MASRFDLTRVFTGMSAFGSQFLAFTRAPRTPPETEVEEAGAPLQPEPERESTGDRAVAALLEGITRQLGQIEQGRIADFQQLSHNIEQIGRAQGQLAQAQQDLADTHDENMRVLQIDIAQTKAQLEGRRFGGGQSAPTTPSQQPMMPTQRRTTMFAATGGRLVPTSPMSEQRTDSSTFGADTPGAAGDSPPRPSMPTRGRMRGGMRGGFSNPSARLGSLSPHPDADNDGVAQPVIGNGFTTSNHNRDRGKAWFPVGSVSTFQGEYHVGSKDPQTNPLEWLKQVRETMVARHIEPEFWVRECVTCIASKVLDRFRLAFGQDPSSALALRILPNISAMPDPIYSVSWNDFCFWLVREFITPSHQGQLEQLIAAEKCKGLQDVDEYCERFMEHCLYSDFLALYTAGHIDESQLAEVLAVADKPERQRYFRLALPDAVQAALTDEETRRQAQDGSWAFSLAGLIAFARASANAHLNAARRRGVTPSLNHMALVPPPQAAPDHSVLHAMMATMQDIKDQLADIEGGQCDMDLDMYLKISDFVESPPPQELIDARLASQLCIACGGADHHWRKCTKLREGTPGLGERIDAAEAAERARKQERRQARSFPRRTPTARAASRAELQYFDTASAASRGSVSSELVPYNASTSGAQAAGSP